MTPTTTVAPPPTSGSSGSTASLNTGAGQLTNESTFLQLLVAQIKNQDPMNPTDSIQFVGQLVSFSQLEQLLSINQNMQTLVQDASGVNQPPAAPTPPTSSPAPAPGTTN